MKLYYYKHNNGITNFGDDINPWLWNKLIPEVLDENEESFFIGIGSLLNDILDDLLPKTAKKIVFSSGVGYGDSLPNIDKSWKFYCLRGQLSAKSLGLPPEIGVADGALLVRRLFNPSGEKQYRFAFMPHIYQAMSASNSWKSLCEQLRFGYIDPRWTIERVLSEIDKTEILLTEALHGAIVADSFRVPWVPIVTTKIILEFKWRDWCSSIGIDYQPIRMMPMWDKDSKTNLLLSSKKWVKRKLVSKQLFRIANNSNPILSSNDTIEKLTVELESRIEKFKTDVKAGHFK